MSVTALTKVTVHNRDKVAQILVSADLRINERVDFRIHVLEAFQGHVCEPCYHLLRLHLRRQQFRLGFPQLLNLVLRHARVDFIRPSRDAAFQVY